MYCKSGGVSINTMAADCDIINTDNMILSTEMTGDNRRKSLIVFNFNFENSLGYVCWVNRTVNYAMWSLGIGDITIIFVRSCCKT